MSKARMDKIVKLISRRFRAVGRLTIAGIPHSGLRLFLRPGPWVISRLGRGPLRQALIEQLGDSYKK
jgi:hypothetical protein